MQYKLFLIGSLLFFLSCGSKEKLTENIFEKVIAANSGIPVDISDVTDNASNQDAYGYITYDGKDLISPNTSDLKGSVQLIMDQNRLIVNMAYGNESIQFVASVNNVSPDFKLPLVVPFESESDQPKAIMAIMSLGDESNLFNTPIPYQGTITITEFNAKEIVFEIDGKGAEPQQAENPTAWKKYSGKFTLKSPVVIAAGIEKDQVWR